MSDAPIFSNLSSKSMSLATDTPSSVIVGLPKPLSKITALPVGPSVTLTASATLSTPALIDSFASKPYFTIFAIKIPFFIQRLRARRTRPYRAQHIKLCIQFSYHLRQLLLRRRHTYQTRHGRQLLIRADQLPRRYQLP